MMAPGPVALLAGTVRDARVPPYQRALAATRLGHELDKLRRTDAAGAARELGLGSPGGSPRQAHEVPIEDALLELVGYASRQQRRWQLWANSASENVKEFMAEHAKREAPPSAELTVADARLMRQNCATVLAMIVSLNAGEAGSTTTLHVMKSVPDPIASSAKMLRQTILRKMERERETEKKKNPPPNDSLEEVFFSVAQVAESSFSESLDLVHAASAPDLGVAKRADAFDEANRFQGKAETADAVTNYIRHFDASPKGRPLHVGAQRLKAGGVVRSVRGNYRASNEPFGRRRYARPNVLFADDGRGAALDVPLPNTKRHADELLGYQAPMLIVPMPRPNARPQRDAFKLVPRGYDATEQAMQPATALGIVQEYREISSMTTYAGLALRDEFHPRNAQLRSLFGGAASNVLSQRQATWNSYDTLRLTTPLDSLGQETLRPTFGADTASAALLLTDAAQPKEFRATPSRAVVSFQDEASDDGVSARQAATSRRRSAGGGKRGGAASVCPSDLPLAFVAASDFETTLQWSPRMGAIRPDSMHRRLPKRREPFAQSKDDAGDGTARSHRSGDDSPLKGTTLWSSTLPRRPRVSGSGLALAGGLESYEAREARRTPTAAAKAAWAPGQGGAWTTERAAHIYNGAEDERLRVDALRDAELRRGASYLAFKSDARFMIRAKRAERKEAWQDQQTAADEAKSAWRETRKTTILNGPASPERRRNGSTETSFEDSTARPPPLVDASMQKVAGAYSSMRLAAEREGRALRAENSAVIDASQAAVPMRLAAFFGGAGSAGAAGVRKRLQKILGRWICEFEKAQMALALAFWRIACIEGDREEARCAYRRHGAVCRLTAFLDRCKRRSLSKFFSRLVSRAGLLIFVDRCTAAKRIETAYRRSRGIRLFISKHDALPLGGALADVYLAPKRSLGRFFIDHRVRSERRQTWSAAILLQRRARRNRWRGNFLFARNAAVLFVSLWHMWPVRRRYLLMRRSAVCVQASVIMFLVRRPFLRLRVAARTAQRECRGYVARLKCDELRAERRFQIEMRVSAPYVMQQRWRGALARMVFRRLLDEIESTNLAAVRLQFAWYRRQNAFPTFLLLSCLRVTDEEDVEYAKKLRTHARVKARQKIVRCYVKHSYRDRFGAVGLIGGAWLRYVAMRAVMGVRRSRWARRKMQCFFRARMKYRHKCARLIALRWFKSQKGRFLKHLTGKMCRFSAEEDALVAQRREAAAATIQAIIHGEFCRSLLKREKMALRVQRRLARGPQARAEAQTRRSEKKARFVAAVVARPMRDSVLTQLVLFKKSLSKKARVMQRIARGFLVRTAMRAAVAFASRVATAGDMLQRAVRRRGRSRLASKNVEKRKREKKLDVAKCLSLTHVLDALTLQAQPPSERTKAWLWVDFEDGSVGLPPSAACRRSGRPDAVDKLKDRRVMNLPALAAVFDKAKRRKLESSGKSQRGALSPKAESRAPSPAEDVFEAPSALAWAMLKRMHELETDAEVLEDGRPLLRAERFKAALLVCTMRYGGVSTKTKVGLKSNVEALPLKKLPKAAQKLVVALSDDALYDAGRAPADLTLAMMRKFCAGFHDAEQTLSALDTGAFSRPPWAQQRAERDVDQKRLKRAVDVRTTAVERLQSLLRGDRGLLHFVVEDVLKCIDATKNALRERLQLKLYNFKTARAANQRLQRNELDKARTAMGSSDAPRKGRRKTLVAEDSATSALTSLASPTSPMTSAVSPMTSAVPPASPAKKRSGDSVDGGTVVTAVTVFTAESVDVRPEDLPQDVSAFIDSLNRLQGLQIDVDSLARVVPGCASSEALASLAAQSVFLEKAVRQVRLYQGGALLLQRAFRRRSAKKLVRLMSHARALGRAQSAYLADRRGAAVTRAWGRDMANFVAGQQKEADEYWALLKDQDAQTRLNVLRFGWRLVFVRFHDLTALKFVDEQGDRNSQVAVYERIRPAKPKRKARGDDRYRDDDQARDAAAKRLTMAAEEPVVGEEPSVGYLAELGFNGPDHAYWVLYERERMRIEPRYDLRDDAAALAAQTAWRRCVGQKIAFQLRRDRARRAREERDRAAWELRQTERMRHVTVRLSLFDRDRIVFAATQPKGAALEESDDESVDDEDEDGPFESSPAVLAASLQYGAHVVAKFSALVDDDHWYPGTLFDTSGLQVEGLPLEASASGFPQHVSVQFDDGDVDERVLLSALRLPRLRLGDFVEARWMGGDTFFRAKVLPRVDGKKHDDVLEDASGGYRLRYDDGDVEAGVSRALIRFVDFEDRLAQAARNDRKRFISLRVSKRHSRRAARLKREATRQTTVVSDLLETFESCQRLNCVQDIMKEHRSRAAWARAPDAHALQLADMAKCAAAALELCRPRVCLELKVEYTRVALRYGWEEMQDGSATFFSNTVSGKTTWDRPAFTFDEEQAARRAQVCYRGFVARRDFHRSIGSQHLPTLVRDVRRAARNAAWTPRTMVGVDLEAVPLELWLSRRGYDQKTVAAVLKVVSRKAFKGLDSVKLAQLSEAQKKVARKVAFLERKQKTLLRLVRLQQSPQPKPESKDLEREDALLEALGFTTTADRRWLRKAGDAKRTNFIAYWRSPSDARPMAQVLAAAKDVYALEVARHFKNQQARCDAMAGVLSRSVFPVTFLQLDRHFLEFTGKAAAAQEALKIKLLDVATTSTAVDEREALKALAAGAARLKALMNQMGLVSLVNKFDDAIRRSRETCEPLADPDAAPGDPTALFANLKAAQRGSSVAARACWILDDDIFGVALKAWACANLTQKNARRRLARLRFKSTLEKRQKGTLDVQCFFRCVSARRLSILYQTQQVAAWHMLYDAAAQAFYFLQVATQQVSWTEPGGPDSFRPQVKDRYTGRYVLAWPQLDRPKPLSSQQPKVGMCMVCKLEPSTRRCGSCEAPKFEAKRPTWGDGAFHFCFACFAAHHDTPQRRGHSAIVTKETSAPPLRCIVCQDLATRRCRGLFLRSRGKALLHRFILSHAVPAEASGKAETLSTGISVQQLRQTLRLAGAPYSQQRVEDLALNAESAVRRHVDALDEAADGQGARTLRLAVYHEAVLKTLSKWAAECSDDYCEEHYASTHARGPRLKHVWQGFERGCPVCALCEAKPARKNCASCDDDLCEDCAATAHARGKKMGHVLKALLESADNGFCECCGFRAASSDHDCTLCSAKLCDSCRLFDHDSVCSKRGTAKASALGVDPDHPTRCVVCGRKPEKRCVQCDDVYCMFMGKPRCFFKMHAKGERRNHEIVQYTFLDDLDKRVADEDSIDKAQQMDVAANRARAAEDFQKALDAQRDAEDGRRRDVDVAADKLLARQLREESAIKPASWLAGLFNGFGRKAVAPAVAPPAAKPTAAAKKPPPAKSARQKGR
ncbi:hypothetical protein M885DRAFT_618542 [Pelagophyceae sp. CCMP2097]|nr:hypothetical protein M885DRAFT_618542 [Pelagophyceae sp. CCMP2097]